VRRPRPTIEKVRAELGMGSPNMLLRLLEVWWAELAGRLAKSPKKSRNSTTPKSASRS